MKSEDTRNLFLAIALSVLVMAGWQYFYAGPLYQREHQAQTEANQASQANTAPSTEAQPTNAATASPPGGGVGA
jgi:YidC/Oxa1 family membrane protein insertase